MSISRRDLLSLPLNARGAVITLSSVVGLFAVVLLLSGADRPGKAAQDKDAEAAQLRAELKELKGSFEKFQKADKDRDHAVSWLSRTSPPVGSVEAFAGDWPPRKADRTTWTELDIGWLRCDGRKLADLEAELHKELEKHGKKAPAEGALAELWAVLPRLPGGKPAETLPDYRGLFLRGIDPTGTWDPERMPADRSPGSYQADAIAKHKHHVTLTGGGHGHDIPFHQQDGKDNGLGNGKVVGYVKQTQSKAKTLTDGSHTHVGYTDEDAGGKETRPKNRAVHWIIKFK
jgi:hypothetical protein